MKTPLILWNTPYRVGGVSSFCFHLSMVTGWPIVRMGRVAHAKAKPIEGWPLEYHLVTLDMLISSKQPLILGGGSWLVEDAMWERLFEKRRAPTWWVFHDQTEFKSMPHTKFADGRYAIVLRSANLAHQKKGHLLPQPYAPRYSATDTQKPRRQLAACTARVDPMKNSHLIVLANRMLPKAAQISLLGAPNRMYVFSKSKSFPELKECKGLPSMHGAGAEALRAVHYSVDLTTIKGDGGGMQYTTLEAMDAGAIPILHTEWTRPDGPIHKVRYFAVDNETKLAELLLEGHTPAALDVWREENRALLDKNYSPEKVKQAYSKLILGV